jgi:hypothetical protein
MSVLALERRSDCWVGIEGTETLYVIVVISLLIGLNGIHAAAAAAAQSRSLPQR